MKIKEGFAIKTIAGEKVAIPVGENVIDFTAMISLNDTAAFIWTKLQENDLTVDELVKALTDEYEVSEDIARKDVEGYVLKLKEANLLE